MKAKETNLPKFLNAPKQFIIPVYQRTYSWKRQQCIKLWDDIVRIGSNDKTSDTSSVLLSTLKKAFTTQQRFQNSWL